MNEIRTRSRPDSPPLYAIAVFERGFAGRAVPWGTPVERRVGFLGRVLSSPGKCHAWLWEPTGYRPLGAFADSHAACAALKEARGKTTPGARRKQIR